jgi:hypothetical protein
VSETKYHPRLLVEDQYGLWDEFVEKSERGTVFHQTHWLKSFGWPFMVLGCYDDHDALIGGMPLSYQRIAGLKTARPPYLTPYLGPVVFRTEGKYHRALTLEKDVALSLIDYVKATYDFVRIPLPPNYADIQSFKQNSFKIDVENTYIIELGNLDRVWKELDQDKRRKIRKGYGEGLSCQLSDDLDQFFPLLTHSLTAHCKSLSQNRVGEIRDWYEVLSAENQAKHVQVKDSRGRVCAGAILVWDSKRAYYLLSGMDRDISSHNSMAFLLWECMRFCSEELGLREFDFDGSEVPSVEVFFRGFGGRLTLRFSAMWGRPLMWPIRRTWFLMNGAVRASMGVLAR